MVSDSRILNSLSPLAYVTTKRRLFTDLGDKYSWNNSMKFRLDGYGQRPRYLGFDVEDLHAECLNFFANASVKLRFEFVDTDVMQIVRDTRSVNGSLTSKFAKIIEA